MPVDMDFSKFRQRVTFQVDGQSRIGWVVGMIAERWMVQGEKGGQYILDDKDVQSIADAPALSEQQSNAPMLGSNRGKGF